LSPGAGVVDYLVAVEEEEALEGYLLVSLVLLLVHRFG